jgi:hypothetical protein
MRDELSFHDDRDMASVVASLTNNPILPLELEREIFTIAARVHKETIPTLLRVAHRVFVW